MAGKSTFLRSMGVNYILAMAGRPRAVRSAVSACYRRGRDFRAGGYGHRQCAEQAYERRCGPAGGLHRRGRQRTGYTAAANSIRKESGDSHREPPLCIMLPAGQGLLSRWPPCRPAGRCGRCRRLAACLPASARPRRPPPRSEWPGAEDGRRTAGQIRPWPRSPQPLRRPAG